MIVSSTNSTVGNPDSKALMSFILLHKTVSIFDASENETHTHTQKTELWDSH